MIHLMKEECILTLDSHDIVGYAGGLLHKDNTGSSIFKKKCTASCNHITQVYWSYTYADCICGWVAT